MEISYLGHAGFCVETEHAIIVMDPWLSPEGAFDSAWFQFPCNHHLAPWLIEKLRHSNKQRFVYISHEHHDHFDADFLKSLAGIDFKFVVPRFQRPALRQELAKLGAAPVLSSVHAQETPFPGGYLKLYLDDSGLNRDSGVLVRADGHSFLNLNDCKLYDLVPAIVREEGPISAFACQFSGATWHPTCYDYVPEEYARISQQKRMGKFEMVARAIHTIQPRVYLPTSGPPCFLDPALIHLNFQPVNIFPRARFFLDYLRRRLPGLASLLPEVMPGDVVHAADGSWEQRGTERVSEKDFDSYIRSYASRYAGYFEKRQSAVSRQEAERIIECLRTELLRKLSAFTLHDRIRVPLYFRLSDLEGHVLEIDFPAKSVERVHSIAGLDYYSICTPSWQIARVLDGSITWEQFTLTFRVRLNREPDVYQTLIHGFLLMEPEDMNWFCGKLLEIEQRQNRVLIEAGGLRYSIDRFCPHQGADLREGWLHEGRFWVCPRHRWNFALDKDGRCTTSNGSIHAVCLEND